MTIDNLGYVHIAWQDNRDGNWEIYYKKLDDTGVNLTGDERVTNDSASSIRPTITVDGNNNVHVTWYDDRTGNYELFWNKRVEPELTPVNISFIPEEPFEDENVQINITIHNQGNNSASDIQVELLIDSISQENETITLPAQSHQTVSFSWIAEFGSHEVTIKVDPRSQIAEKDEDNNIASGYITVYRITEFSNMSIWANATVKHSVDIDATIEEAANPDPMVTQYSIGKFVNYSADNYFDQATIRIGYADEQLGDINESSLKMYYWDIYDYRGERWVLVEDSGVNT